MRRRGINHLRLFSREHAGARFGSLFGYYKTWFLLILEDLALVVRPELAVLDGKCNCINAPVPTEPGQEW